MRFLDAARAEAGSPISQRDRKRCSGPGQEDDCPPGGHPEKNGACQHHDTFRTLATT